MKNIQLNDTELNITDPELIVVTSNNYKGEMQVRTAADILAEYRQVFVDGTTSDSLDWWIGQDNNHFSIVVVWNGIPHTVSRN